MTRLIDEGDRYIIRRTIQAAADLIIQLHASKLSPAYSAAGALFVHCSNCFHALCKVLDNCADVEEVISLSNPAAGNLRSLHDAAMQLEYILRGDSKRSLSADQLGQRYLEYETVEKYRATARIDTQTSELAKRLAASPKRAVGEEAIRREYDRIKANYEHKAHWYPQRGLADLAAEIGRAEEHFWLLAQYHSSVHGGPLAVLRGPTPAGADLFIVAMNFLARAGRLLAKACGTRLTPGALEVFDSEADLLNLAPTIGPTTAS